MHYKHVKETLIVMWSEQKCWAFTQNFHIKSTCLVYVLWVGVSVEIIQFQISKHSFLDRVSHCLRCSKTLIKTMHTFFEYSHILWAKNASKTMTYNQAHKYSDTGKVIGIFSVYYSTTAEIHPKVQTFWFNLRLFTSMLREWCMNYSSFYPVGGSPF